MKHHIAGSVHSAALRVKAFARFVKRHMRALDASYEMTHALNVAAHFDRIAKEAHFNDHMRLVGELVALGHELCDRTYMSCLTVGVVCEKVRTVLMAIGMSSIVVESVAHIIPLIRRPRRVEQNVPALFGDEAAVYYAVCDGDMLEALGVTGFVRAFTHQGNDETTAGARGALRYIEDHLLDYEEHMTSAYAKQEATKRAATMRQLCLLYRGEQLVQ